MAADINFLAALPGAKQRKAEKMPAPSAEVIALVRAGRKAAAIKLYRKETGANLHEANQVIERESLNPGSV